MGLKDILSRKDKVRFVCLYKEILLHVIFQPVRVEPIGADQNAVPM